MSEWTALIVEDESDSADVVSRILSYHNIEHQIAVTAEEALQKLEGFHPTLLIVDLSLPGMDGWSFLNKIQSNPATSDIQAVATTAYHSTEVAEEAITAGFRAYFPKPIEATSFVRELEGIISGDF